MIKIFENFVKILYIAYVPVGQILNALSLINKQNENKETSYKHFLDCFINKFIFYDDNKIKFIKN